jgi:hypothetical protein|nr:MAG TPA: Protein of unknown function (DUF551) [Bacteriophage sp.]
MPEWISVKDRLPEIYEDVLVIASGNPRKNITLSAAYCFGYISRDGWVIEEYPEWENAYVTHWMMLPDPPKEDDLHEF